MRSSLDRDGALLHRLEERRLRARRGSVDLVGEQDVREHGTGNEHRLAQLHGVEAGDLLRRGVGSELDAPELCAEHVGHRAREKRLGAAGRPLDQDVALAEGGDEEQVDGVALADDDLADLLAGALAQVDQVLVWAFWSVRHGPVPARFPDVR